MNRLFVFVAMASKTLFDACPTTDKSTYNQTYQKSYTGISYASFHW